MNPGLSEFDKSSTPPSAKQRKAALKAWRTIRNKSRAVVGKSSLRIEKFLTLDELSSLRHPDAFESGLGKNEEVLSYSKGIISLFHKTPADIACGRFWEVRWAYGCPLDCNYCYLRGTRKGNMKPSPLKVDYVLGALDEAFKNIREPAIFNSGELSDSLMYPSLMEKIVDKFEEQNKHKIVLLSKMGSRNIDFLKKYRKQTICAWSINATEVSKKWERAAPLPDERIAAAKEVNNIGYDVRIRIDPIFPIDDWKTHYGDLLHNLLANLEPKRIVLGTPRGLWKTIHYAKEQNIDMSWTRFFGEDSSWGKKIEFDQRKEIYEYFYDKLKSLGYPLSHISLCKETNSMWKAMNLVHVPLTCNCYGPAAL